MSKFFLAAVSFLAGTVCAAQVSFGNSSLFNDGWRFRLDGKDTTTIGVTLPYDWSARERPSPYLASCTGFLPGGIGLFTKSFDGKAAGSGKVFIYFEGVYNRSSVYLNGHLIGGRPGGYASFLLDMTPYIHRSGSNLLTVRVDHSRYADSRFYTGSGIYRNVWLVGSSDTRLAQWGVGYKVEELSASQAVLNVDAAVDSLGDRKCRLEISLRDSDGAVVAKVSSRAAEANSVRIKVPAPHLWSLDDPYLYKLEVKLLSGKELIDRTMCNVGIRRIAFDPDKGFSLNGNTLKIKGVCLHHDAGVLGAAVPDDVWERRLLNLKAIGANAIRTSHNPETPAFYDICDRIGLLVMDEAFDEWEYPKRKWIEGWNAGEPGYDGTCDFFEEWGETDLRDMVRRDRNHPCVIMWSIGNEVDYPNDPYSHPILAGGNSDFTQPSYGGYKPDAPSAMRIGEIAKRLAACVRSVDNSRPVTGALAGVAMSNQTAYPGAVDIVGYNYSETRYAKDHAAYPLRVIYGSENSPNYPAWAAVRDNDFISGLFLWTGADYLGESRPWPSRGFYSGLLDLGSYTKPRGHFWASLWCTAPVCYIGTYLQPDGKLSGSTDAWDTWNYDEGDIVNVACYTNAASARLFLNGRQAGEEKPYNRQNGVIEWRIPYSPGTLKAVGYDAGGTPVSEYVINTSMRPSSLRVTADKTELAGRGSVAHLSVEVLDDNGNPVTMGDNMITCTVSGPAELLGLENSDNSDMVGGYGNSRRAYRGRLLAYIQAEGGTGDIMVKFSSPLLAGAEVLLHLQGF